MTDSPPDSPAQACPHEALYDMRWPDLDEWKTSPASFSEHKLEIAGHAVMWGWGKPYVEALAEVATRNGGVILEVGYGMGHSARHIQRYPIDKHLVIEMNQDVFEQARIFAATSPHPVEPLLGTWQEVVPTLADSSIDGILFDPYPLNKDEIDCHNAFLEQAYRLLKPGGILTYYSGEETDYSPAHYQLLQQAGFSRIDKRVCPVKPSPDCPYWHSDTMLVPIIIK